MELNPHQRPLHPLPPLEPHLPPLLHLHLPRLKHLLHVLYAPDLLHPHLHILPRGIIIKALLDRIERARLPRIIAHTGIILPITPVAADVVVGQQALVPLGADAPVDAQVLGQEGGHVLAQPVRGVARQEELAHAGVDEAVARGAFEEAPHCVLGGGVVGGGVFPGLGGVVLEAGDVEEGGAEFAGGEAEVVAPEELEADGGGALGGEGVSGGRLRMSMGMMDGEQGGGCYISWVGNL